MLTTSPPRSSQPMVDTERAISNQSIDGTSEVEQLKEELEAEREQRKSVEDELASLKEDYSNYRRAMSKKLDSLKSQLEELRASGSSGDEPHPSDGENGSPSGDSGKKTTLEQIADDEQDNPVGVQVGPSVERAATIMSNWDKWSDKGRKGRNIRDGLKKLLETATGESLAWKQVYRAARKVEQLTKGKIVFTDTKRHGKVLLQPSSEGAGG